MLRARRVIAPADGSAQTVSMPMGVFPLRPIRGIAEEAASQPGSKKLSNADPPEAGLTSGTLKDVLASAS